MLTFKIDVLASLKDAGYNTYRIRKDKLLSENTLHTLRTGGSNVNAQTIGAICSMLRCQPGDILENVITDKEKIKYF